MASKIIGLKEFVKQLDPKKAGRANINALNQTATEYRKTTVNEAANIYNIKKGRIKKDSRERETTFIERARAGNEKAVIEYKGGRPGLQHFSPNKQMKNRKKPPQVKIKKGGSLETVDRGFFAKKSLWQRGGDERYPIARRTGPSMKQMYEDDSIKGKFERKIGSLFSDKFTVQIKKMFKL